MVAKLRLWLAGWGQPYLPRPALFQKPATSSADHQDLAFQLACADEISEVLPEALQHFQQSLDSALLSTEQTKVVVLFSHPASSETFVHHAQGLEFSKELIQELHRRFTLSRAVHEEVLQFPINEEQWRIVPRALINRDNFKAWMLLAFDGEMPSLEKLQWHTSPMEISLSKGINAWHQRDTKIQAALEAERSIFAAELHDSLAQVLGYLRMKSAKLDKLCQEPQYQSLQPITKDLADYTHCAYRQTRELITSSRLTLQANSLSQGVINSIRKFEQQSMIVFELDNRLKANLLSSKQSMQILYIIRESLNNIVRHSHASHARIILSQQQQQLKVIIEDNGQGIDPGAARKDSFGLQIMHERAERIGAELHIGDRPNGGTRVELLLEVSPGDY